MSDKNKLALGDEELITAFKFFNDYLVKNGQRELFDIDSITGINTPDGILRFSSDGRLFNKHHDTGMSLGDVFISPSRRLMSVSELDYSSLIGFAPYQSAFDLISGSVGLIDSANNRVIKTSDVRYDKTVIDTFRKLAVEILNGSDAIPAMLGKFVDRRYIHPSVNIDVVYRNIRGELHPVLEELAKDKIGNWHVSEYYLSGDSIYYIYYTEEDLLIESNRKIGQLTSEIERLNKYIDTLELNASIKVTDHMGSMRDRSNPYESMSRQELIARLTVVDIGGMGGYSHMAKYIQENQNLKSQIGSMNGKIRGLEHEIERRDLYVTELETTITKQQEVMDAFHAAISKDDTLKKLYRILMRGNTSLRRHRSTVKRIHRIL